jgi:antitoxin HigA-1
MANEPRPTHPGEVLRRDVIEPLGVTVTEAARRLGVTRKALSELLNDRSSLSPRMAVRIAEATGTSAESWLEMQMKLDLWNVRHVDRQSSGTDIREGSLRVT